MTNSCDVIENIEVTANDIRDAIENMCKATWSNKTLVFTHPIDLRIMLEGTIKVQILNEIKQHPNYNDGMLLNVIADYVSEWEHKLLANTFSRGESPYHIACDHATRKVVAELWQIFNVFVY